MGRPTFLMYEGMYNGKITRSNKCDSTSLGEPTDSTDSQKETVNANTEEQRLSKVILIVDDDPDATTVFSLGLQDVGFKVYTYNDPLEALSKFRPNFYDLLLVDINMPQMNGIELTRQILELDTNVRICFITAGEINIEALREVYPTISVGCFIKKPITLEYLVKRIKAELE